MEGGESCVRGVRVSWLVAGSAPVHAGAGGRGAHSLHASTQRNALLS
jgi:hypothetical protein